MNGENRILKKIINTFLVLLVTFSATGMPVSAETTEENSTTTQTSSNVSSTEEDIRNLYGEDFEIEVTELEGLTEENLLTKAGAYTIDGTEIIVDSESFNELKLGVSGISYSVIIKSETEALTINVYVKDSQIASTTMTTFVTEVDDKLEVTIPDYNASSGMDIRNIYDVAVKVNFDDSTSLNKKITFTLPQGLKYASYPTNNVVIGGIETQATGVLGDFIENVTRPVTTLGTGYSGDLIYEFVPGTVAIEINIKVQVDEVLYLKDGAIAGDIIAKAEKSTTTIGEVKFENVMTVGSVTPVLYAAGDPFNKNVLQEEQVTTTKLSMIKTTAASASSTGTYAKKYTFYYYYPKELKFIKSNKDSSIVEKNLTEGYIKFEFGSGTLQQVTLTLQAEGLNATTYTASRPSYIEVEAYNGDLVTINGGNSNQLIKIVVQDASSIANKLNGSIFRQGYYYNYDESYTSSGPYFRIMNVAAKDMEKQWYEVNIDSNYQTNLVAIPDISDSNKVYYQTNLDSTLKQVPSSAIGVMPGATAHKGVFSSKLGLANGEYLTVVKAYLGTVPKQYYSYDTTSMDYITKALNITGKLAPGITSASIIVKTYEAETENDTPVANTILTLSGSVTRKDEPISTVYRTVPATTITAGSTKKVSTSLLTNRYPVDAQTSVLVDPVIYIKLLDDMQISNPVAKIDGVTVNTTFVDEYVTTQGVRFARIEVDGIIGAYIDDKIKNLTLDFDVTISLQASSQSYNWNTLMFVKDEINTYSSYWNNISPVSDIYDVDNDNDLTELIMPMGAGNTKLIINSNENLLIDTYIYPTGESRRPAYDGTDEKAVGFTPGTHGVYTVDILNNVDGIAKDIETYIPVPKVGNNYGESFQDDAFKWNMKLGAVPVLKVEDADGNDITAAKSGNYEITYSTNATNESNYEAATYSTVYDSNTALIKVTNISGMERGERAYLTFEYIVDEDTASITLNPEKLGSINDFRPYYKFNAGSVAGALSGTRVGARLDIGVVEGFIFKDTNYNGIFDSGIDNAISGKVIDLYKKDNSNVYQYVTSSTTSSTGAYSFEDLSNGVYKVDFNNALETNQKFTIKNAGTNDSLDSDVTNIGADTGLVIDIDPTSQTAKQISAGIIDYELAVIDITKSSTTIKAVNDQQPNITELLTTTITPAYFNQIKSGNIVWSSSDTAIVTIDNEGYIKGLTAGTAIVTVKIADIYGYETTDTITVTVLSNDIPVISGSDITIEAGTTFDKLTIGVTISDTEDGSIALTDTKVTITDNVPVNGSNQAVTPGTYTVIYAVEDTDGNTASKTINVTVEDTTAPTITTTDTSVTVEANSTSTLPDWETVFGVNVTDIVDGDITSDTSKVTYSVSPTYTANNVPDTYTITVTAIDTAGNSSITTLTYIVEDTTAPSITTTATSVTVEANSTSALPDWETVFEVNVTDIVDGDITSDTSKVTYSVSPSYTANNNPDTYTITITATDTAGNTSTTTVTYIVVDTTAPTITTTDTVVTVEANSTSTLPDWETVFGVNVTDIVDGDITSDTSKVAYSVSPSYTANNIPDTYTITVTATDTAGNISTTTLTYTVTDTAAPVITTTDTTVTVEANSTSTLPDWETVFGVNVTDIVDGDITSDTSKVTYSVSPAYTANNIPDTYTITITATDTEGNSSTTALTYILEDTTAPSITTTATTVTVEANSTSTLPDWETVFGVNVTDIVDGDITSDISKVTYSVSPSYTANNIPDTYTITVTATDTAGNISTTTMTYIVEDTTGPTIMTTATTVTVEANSTSTLPDWETVFGVDVTDIVDGDITSDTSKVTYSVSPSYTANNIPDTYTITVTATDIAGNTSTTTLTYIVTDTTAPTITTTATTVTVEANNTSTLPDWETVFGVNVTDIVDGDITSDTSKVTYNVSPSYTANNIPDTYTITVTVTDTAGNTSTTTLTYTVEDTTAPSITTTATTVTVEANSISTLPDWETVFGVNVTDIVDGDITSDTSKVTYSVSPSYTANNIPDTYTITVTATDTSGNTSTMTLTYIVEDTTLPTLSIPNATVYVAKGDVQTETGFITLAGITATDIACTPTVAIDMTAIDFDTVGTYTATVTATDAANNTTTGTITVEIIELLTGENFTVALADVASADFVKLANALGWELNTSITTKTASDVTLESTKPTTVGIHNVTFKNAEGVELTVQVLVTNEVAVNNEVVTASNFTVALTEVATADFITLANAKGYDITDQTTPIEIPVLETTARPTKVGTHTVRFETANGGYAEVEVLVTNEVAINNEVVTASNFTVTLTEVATADFITLANAKGYDITNPTTPIEIPVLETTARPTTVGTHTVRFETTNGGYAEVEVLVTNEGPVNNEVVTASDFTVALADVATADFITLANAKGYDITDQANPIEIPVLETTARPTTVGTHTVRFETVNGGYAEVQVLVTNENPINNEVVIASNFTVALADVATADFILLANAKGYDITDSTNPLEIPITEVTARPTTIGTHMVRFETANGGYAEVQVLVTNEAPVNNESVLASNFTVKLADVPTADFVQLANAKGYDITNPANPIEIPVIFVSSKPTTIGTYVARFETLNGGYAEVDVEVVTEGSDYEISANHIVMGIAELQDALNNSNLNETIISHSDAKVVNTITGETKTDNLGVEVKDLTAPEVKVYNVVLSYEHNNVSAFSTDAENTSTIITKEITLSVEDDTNDQSQTELPKSGQHTREFYIIGVFLLMLNALIINYIIKKKRKVNR